MDDQKGNTNSDLSQLDSPTVVKTVVVSHLANGQPANQLDQWAYFVLIKGPDSLMGSYWKVDQSKMEIGRSRKCKVHIPDSTVSKVHITVKLNLDRSRVNITDHKSTNGSYVGEQPLSTDSSYTLEDNDIISFGNIALKFLDIGNPEITSLPKNLKKFKRSSIDQLTKASNRYVLEASAPELFSLSKKNNHHLSIIIFDIDFFKQINDSYGHPAGDFILKETASLSRSCFRSQDLFVRVGGEEFCIVLNSSTEEANKSIERVRCKIQENVFSYQGNDIQVTISAGLAERSVKDTNWKDIYQRADKALYQAKKTGRNKICQVA